MVEHRLPKPGVAGSNPVSRSICICVIEENTLKFEGGLYYMKHITTIIKPNLKRDADHINCRECATSCQSACKTSCTVGNQTCRNQ